MKIVNLVCKCPKCQNIVKTKVKDEFNDRTCTNCGTVFRKIGAGKWKIFNEKK